MIVSTHRPRRPSAEWDIERIGSLIQKLADLRKEMLRHERDWRHPIEALPEENRSSARNLIHYLALRNQDVRGIQSSLASLGLSSVGRAESHVMSNLDDVLKLLYRLIHRSFETERSLDREDARRTLEARADALLGTAPGPRMMVTMPSEAAHDYSLVRDLLSEGMTCMRINAAHDDPTEWAQMIEHLHRARRELGRDCRIWMDLCGPRLRTGDIEPGPRVLKIKPRRDVYGRIQSPAMVWLAPLESDEPAPASAEACLVMPKVWIDEAQIGDRIDFIDSRGADRSMTIVGIERGHRWAEIRQTCYITPETRFEYSNGPERATGAFGLPCREQTIPLRPSDRLIVTRPEIPGRPAGFEPDGTLREWARIGCTLPEAFVDVKPGDSIWFDDGRIGGIVREAQTDRLVVDVTHTKPGGDRLEADKGIHLPDSDLKLPALTDKDLEDLDFAVRNADMIGFSFVHRAEDVRELQSRLEALEASDVGLVLKIETRRGFENLPSLLLAGFNSRRVGIMLARGDLAVECGFQRLAEVQEEILWLCEAAHVPVVWTTQVLDRLAQEGSPSRAEIPDAAMTERAEAVMLNQGPFILQTMKATRDIFERLRAHQDKKRSMLHVPERFLKAPR